MKREILVSIVVMLLCTTVIPNVERADENQNKTIDITTDEVISILKSELDNNEDISKLKSDGSIITVNNNNGDFLDQYQDTDCNLGISMYNDKWYAQSFTPNKNILTRLFIYIYLNIITLHLIQS